LMSLAFGDPPPLSGAMTFASAPGAAIRAAVTAPIVTAATRERRVLRDHLLKGAGRKARALYPRSGVEPPPVMPR
jgi:hypothetical protein